MQLLYSFAFVLIFVKYVINNEICGSLQFEVSPVRAGDDARLRYRPNRFLTDTHTYRTWVHYRTFNGSPAIILDSRRLGNALTKFTEQSYREEYQLIIHNTTFQDSGIYRVYCQFNSYSQRTTLQVISDPTVAEPLTSKRLRETEKTNPGTSIYSPTKQVHKSTTSPTTSQVLTNTLVNKQSLIPAPTEGFAIGAAVAFTALLVFLSILTYRKRQLRTIHNSYSKQHDKEKGPKLAADERNRGHDSQTEEVTEKEKGRGSEGKNLVRTQYHGVNPNAGSLVDSGAARAQTEGSTTNDHSAGRLVYAELDLRDTTDDVHGTKGSNVPEYVSIDF